MRLKLLEKVQFIIYDLIGNNIRDNITSKSIIPMQTENTVEYLSEILKRRYISPEKRQQIIGIFNSKNKKMYNKYEI